MSTRRNNFSTKGLAQDQAFYDPTPGADGYNPFSVNGSWTRAVPYLCEKFLSDPSPGGSTQYLTWTATTAPSYIEFQLARRTNGDYMAGPTFLNFRLNATAASTAYGAEFYGVDCLGCHAIDKIEYIYNGRPLMRVYGWELPEWYDTLPLQESTAAKLGCGGGFNDDPDTIPARKAFLQQADNYLKVRLLTPWENYRGGIWLYALPATLTVRVTFAEGRRFIAHTSTTAPTAPYVDKLKLYNEGIHFLESHRQTIYNMLYGTGSLSTKFYHTDVEWPTALTTSTTTFSSTVSVPIRQLANPTYLLRVNAYYLGFSVPQGNSSGSNTVYEAAPTEYLPIETVKLQDGNLQMTDTYYCKTKSSLAGKYSHAEQSDALVDGPRIFPEQPVGRKQALIPFCHPILVDASNYDGAFGTLVPRRYTAPEVVLKFPDETATGTARDPNLYRYPVGTGSQVNVQVRLQAFVHNFLTQRSGDLKVLFVQT